MRPPTRRHALLVAATAAPSLAVSSPPARAVQPADPQDQLEAARQANARHREQLNKVALTNSMEPAFVFRAV